MNTDSQSITREPAEARGWRLGLSCLSVASLAAGVFAGVSWVALILLRSADSIGTILVSVLLLVLPAITFGLGFWTWKTNRVWPLVSLMAVAAGALGIAFALIPAMIVLLSTSRH